MFPKKNSLAKKMVTSILAIAMLSMFVVVVSAGGSSSAKADEIKDTSITQQSIDLALKEADNYIDKRNTEDEQAKESKIIKDFMQSPEYMKILDEKQKEQNKPVPSSMLQGYDPQGNTILWLKDGNTIAGHINYPWLMSKIGTNLSWQNIFITVVNIIRGLICETGPWVAAICAGCVLIIAIIAKALISAMWRYIGTRIAHNHRNAYLWFNLRFWGSPWGIYSKGTINF
jgi:hypothetical protein